VVREAKATIELEPAKDDALVAHLKDGDEATRDAAVRLLVGRRNLAALPPLLEHLKDPDLDVVRRAVGRLVELRAPEAVNPMIEATRRQGPVVEREIVFAVGAIGGEDAEAYLDLVATGHDDPVVRASAEAALGELRARRGRQGASK
jgi:HEAT repeat protein